MKRKYLEVEERLKLWFEHPKSQYLLMPFAEGFTERVANLQLKRHFQNIFEKYFWNNINNKNHGFPGTLAVSFFRSDKELIKRNKWFLFPKSNGTRYFLFAFQNQNENILCLIDRRMEFYRIRDISLRAKIFDGTIIDCELIENKNKKYELQIFDLICLNGKLFKNEIYSQRYKLLEEFFKSSYQYKPTNIFQIILKKPVLTKDEAKNLNPNYDADGWILMNLNSNYEEGKNKSVLKWKEYHTIDFLIEKSADKILSFKVLENDNLTIKSIQKMKGDYKYININSEVFNVNIEKHKMLNENNLIQNLKISCLDDLFGRIVECIFYDGAWIPIKIRNDKSVPNNRSTYQATIVNIKENITLQEFFDFVF